jgi:hypothetical protein
MSRLESAELTKQIVGVDRDAVEHFGRAVSAEQRVYILHSQRCVDRQSDLRKCPFSVALDLGIDEDAWCLHEDVPVLLSICPDNGDLLPNPLPESHGSGSGELSG